MRWVDQLFLLDRRDVSHFSRCLAIDVGNTRTKFGLFLTPEPRNTFPICAEFLAVPHGESIGWDTLQTWLAQGACLVAMAGSNPRRLSHLEQEIRAELNVEPWLLSNRRQIPLSIAVDQPDRVGIDRLLNAVAVNVLRPANRSAIVIDTGTAATVDLIASDGTFQGGAILPGFAMSAQALHHYTELLPLLTVRELANDPPPAAGRNTYDAIRSGVYWGHAGALKEVAAQMCRQRGLEPPDWDRPAHSPASPWFLLTGGGAPFLGPVFPDVPCMPSLALYGLVLSAAAS